MTQASLAGAPFSRVLRVVGMTLLASCMLAPAAAHAGIGASATPTFPTSVTVGQTGLSATLEVANANTTPNTGATNTVCNANDGAPCPAGASITLIPSCGMLGPDADCTPAGYDPGVLQISSTGEGVFGTSCGGLIFDLTPADAASGRLFVTPRSGAHVTLPGAGAVCRIAVTFNVLRSPSKDQSAAPGTQTAQILANTQTSGDLAAFARGTSSPAMTVQRAQPAIATVASANTSVGSQLTDTATVSGRVNPLPGATIDFRLYGPDDVSCFGAPIFTSTVAYPVAGGVVTSGGFTATQPGTYHWVATYSGDANNAPVGGACNEANESTRVSAASSTSTTPGTPDTPGTSATPGTPANATGVPVCTEPPGPAPAGGEICGAGTARVIGVSGCQNKPFSVKVSGTQVATVVFTLDGRRIATLRKRNRGRFYSVTISPARLKIGTHRVLAKTTFTKKSATKPKTLRVVFSRCTRNLTGPQFTG